ncbi:MAG: polysaccharide biosynthesis tyrosine autokinase [Proteobacteria bacterium]|nr:polysaccharide biosynthesis tyrosine autokinase [Pseudomonadota bacterium]
MDQEKFLAMTDAREMWLFAQRNARLIAMIAAGVTAIAILLALILPPRYAGETMIMLDPRRTHVTNMEAVISNLPPDLSAVRSEMDIITSRAVANRVVMDMNLLHDKDFNPSLSGMGWLNRLFASGKKEERVKQEDLDRNAVAGKILKQLDITNDGRSYSFSIRYRDGDAVRAAKIANAFADQYLVDQLEVKYDTTQRANTWLTKRMESLRDEVRASEKAVEDFKMANNLVGVGEETITQQQLTAINSQLLSAHAEQSQAQARYDSIKDLDPDKLATSSVVLSSDLIQKLRQQEAEVRRKEGDLATRYGDRHPMMINTRNELQSIRDKINEEIQKTVSGLQNDLDIAAGKVQSLEKELADLEGKTGAGNQSMVTLRQLQREAAASRSLYEGFLNRSKQITEQQDMQVADARVVARAEVPLKPYFPNMFLFVALGIVMGSVTGFVVALLLEYLDRGFRALSMVERICGVAGLGIVPIAENPEGQLPTDYILEKPLSAYAEAIRSIRTAVHFSNVDVPPKVMMVTSALPGEGKTIFASSMARLLAKSGNKVLLIDGDMRRPRLHSILSLDKTKPDLAMLLAGDVSFEQVIQKDASGADVIIAHTKTPNPQDLLGSRQMERLIASVRDRYDIILIDTPPIMAVADSAMVAKLADATLYIIRWAITPREVVQQGIKHLANYNVKITGVVLAQVNLEEQKQYGYGDYGYYYGHYKDYYTN